MRNANYSNVDKVLSKKFKPSSHILDEYIYKINRSTVFPDQAEENEANAEQELFDQIAQRCLHLIDQHTEAVLKVVFHPLTRKSSDPQSED